MKAATLTCEGKVLIPKCYLANDFFSRFRGLMGRRGLPGDEAILFPRCDSIHTFFMRFPIDVLLVSKEGVVVEVRESLRPWRMLLPKRGVKHVVELAPSRSRELGIRVGHRLAFPGVWE